MFHKRQQNRKNIYKTYKSECYTAQNDKHLKKHIPQITKLNFTKLNVLQQINKKTTHFTCSTEIYFNTSHDNLNTTIKMNASHSSVFVMCSFY